MDKGHGRCEKRRLVVTGALAGYLDWPGAKQVIQVTRERTVRGKTTTEKAYFITSLGRDKADAEKLNLLIRSHWQIEAFFHVRDVTFGEDACRVRKGLGPLAMAWFRAAAIFMLRRRRCPNLAAAQRRFAAKPDEAPALLRPLEEN